MSNLLNDALGYIANGHSFTAQIITVCIIGFGLLLCALSSLFLSRRDVLQDESEHLWTRAAEEGDARAIGFHGSEQ